MSIATRHIAESDLALHYREHRGHVLRFLALRCRWLDPRDREALFHDACIVFLEKTRSGALDHTPMGNPQIRAYLTQTALHKALDERKSAWRRLSVPLDSDAGERPSPPARGLAVEDEVLVRMDTAHMQELISALPERRRRIVKLRLLLDHSPTEIQRRLGISQRVYRRELERGTRAVANGLKAYRSENGHVT